MRGINVTNRGKARVMLRKRAGHSNSCQILLTFLYIYHFLTVIDFSSEKYSGSTGHRNSWY